MKCHTCRQNRDVNKSRPGVSGRLFEGLSVQPLGLLHVDGLHLLREAHLGVSLCQADQRLQLSGVGGHHPAAAAYFPHVDIGLRTNAELKRHQRCITPLKDYQLLLQLANLDEGLAGFLAQSWINVGSCVRDVVLQHSHVQELFLHLLLTLVVQRHQVVGQPAVVCLVLGIQHQEDEVESDGARNAVLNMR